MCGVKGILGLTITFQASGVQKAFGHQRQFLLVSTKCKRPEQGSKELSDLVSDLQQDMSAVVDIKESYRGSELKEHLAMVGDGMSVFQWLLVEGKPADYVGEIMGGAQFYGNRVLKAYKEGSVFQYFQEREKQTDQLTATKLMSNTSTPSLTFLKHCKHTSRNSILLASRGTMMEPRITTKHIVKQIPRLLQRRLMVPLQPLHLAVRHRLRRLHLRYQSSTTTRHPLQSQQQEGPPAIWVPFSSN